MFDTQKQVFSRASEADEDEEEDDPDLVKIKKVQSFFRGWLCRYPEQLGVIHVFHL